LSRERKAPLVLGIFTGLLEHGGVSYAGRQAAAVLASVAAKTKCDYTLLSLKDEGVQHTTFAGQDLTIQGFGGRKARLAMQVVSDAPRVRLAYFGHCNLAPLGFAFSMRGNGRYVVAAYGIEVWQKVTALRSLALKRAGAVTSSSRFTVDKLVEINRISCARVSMIPLCLNPTFGKQVSTKSCKPPLPEGKIILSVARLASSERYKGVDQLIQAMRQLRSLVPDAYYVVVGKGDDQPRLERLAAELGVADRVIFAGARTDDEVAFYYSAASVYAMPSRGEGFGLVFLEAMASGKPIVAAREAATPEVVIDGENGLLVKYGDVDELVRCLARLLSDADMRHQMGRAGLIRFQEHYTFDKFQTRLSNLLLNQIYS